MHKNDVASGSLLAGKAGHALFYGHLYHCFGNDCYFEQFSARLTESIAWVAE